MIAEAVAVLRDQLTKRVAAGCDREHVGEEVAFDVFGSIEPETVGAQASQLCEVVERYLADMRALRPQAEQDIREPAPHSCVATVRVAPLVEIVRIKLRKLLRHDLI